MIFLSLVILFVLGCVGLAPPELEMKGDLQPLIGHSRYLTIGPDALKSLLEASPGHREVSGLKTDAVQTAAQLDARPWGQKWHDGNQTRIHGWAVRDLTINLP